VETIGLIAGNGRLPFLLATEAKKQGLRVLAIAHLGETDPNLAREVDSVTWVRVGQLSRMVDHFHKAGVRRAVMAGGINRVRSLTRARPDSGMLKVLWGLRHFRDDGLLRAVASFFHESGIEIISPTDLLPQAWTPEGPIAGSLLSSEQLRDVALGMEVAKTLGTVDVGQTVVVKNGHVLALEAVEGTDETIRRGARLGGSGCVVVKRSKPSQDMRFDIATVGSQTLELMAEVGASVLALEAGRSLILDMPKFIRAAEAAGISVTGVRPS
jgi:DUF1009 family protein